MRDTPLPRRQQQFIPQSRCLEKERRLILQSGCPQKERRFIPQSGCPEKERRLISQRRCPEKKRRLIPPPRYPGTPPGARAGLSDPPYQHGVSVHKYKQFSFMHVFLRPRIRFPRQETCPNPEITGFTARRPLPLFLAGIPHEAWLLPDNASQRYLQAAYRFVPLPSGKPGWCRG